MSLSGIAVLLTAIGRDIIHSFNAHDTKTNHYFYEFLMLHFSRIKIVSFPKNACSWRYNSFIHSVHITHDTREVCAFYLFLYVAIKLN